MIGSPILLPGLLQQPSLVIMHFSLESLQMQQIPGADDNNSRVEGNTNVDPSFYPPVLKYQHATTVVNCAKTDSLLPFGRAKLLTKQEVEQSLVQLLTQRKHMYWQDIEDCIWKTYWEACYT